MKKFFSTRNTALIIGGAVLCVVFAGLAVHRIAAGAPAYGRYTAADLISFTDYSHADMTKIIPNELETMRMISQQGLPKTLDELSESSAYANNPGLCHDAAHAVGRAAFDFLGAKAFSECTTACFSGCYHGAFQRMSVRTESEGAMLEEVRTLCSALPTTFERDQCFHGSGHGLLLYTNYNLEKALDACKTLGVGPEPGWCYGGVFMEDLGAGPPSAIFDGGAVPEDLHAPCDQVGNDKRAIKWCYQLQPDIFLRAYDNDYAKASAECMKAPEFARGDCFKRLGQLSGVDTPNPPGYTERFCATVPSDYYEDCIIGGVRQIVDFYGTNVGTRVADFCKGLSSDTAKKICYTEYAERMKDLFNDESARTKLCGDFEPPYNASCRAAQSLPAVNDEFLMQ